MKHSTTSSGSPAASAAKRGKLGSKKKPVPKAKAGTARRTAKAAVIDKKKVKVAKKSKETIASKKSKPGALKASKAKVSAPKKAVKNPVGRPSAKVKSAAKTSKAGAKRCKELTDKEKLRKEKKRLSDKARRQKEKLKRQKQEGAGAAPKRKPKPEPSRFGEDWEGNSDAEGSVDSALLDEDICFACGLPSGGGEWSEIILCDICDGEFHLSCANLEMPPRSGWRCQRCMEEIAFFKDMKYELPNKMFHIPPDRGCVRSLVYSPSKPLEQAWQECLQRGYMVVQRVLSFDDIKILTHGTLELTTQRGRQASHWAGALAEIARRLSSSCQNLTDRNGRFDLVIPTFVVEALQLDRKVEPILEKLRTVMGKRKPSIRTHNVVFAPVGSEAQPWHYDDGVRRKADASHRYFTILIPLNQLDDMCGGTEIWHKQSDKTDMIRPRPGDAFVFNGSLFHRGQANSGKTHRLFYYCSFSCVADENIVTN